MRPPEKGGSRTPWQGPAPETSEAPPSTTTVGSIVTDPELLCRLALLTAAGLTPVQASLPPFLVDGLDEHDRRAAAGTVRRCRHLRRSGGPAVFLPWEGPGRLRCGPCAEEAQGRLHGTVEDHRCDACGELVERLSTSVVLARGLVIPVGVCALCRLSRQAGPR